MLKYFANIVNHNGLCKINFVQDSNINNNNNLGLSCAMLRIVELKVEDSEIGGLRENFCENHEWKNNSVMEKMWWVNW